MAISNTVTAELFYFTPPADGSQPYTKTTIDPATGRYDQNWERVPHQVEIENIRGKEDSVSLDTTGFQYFRRPQKYTAFASEEEIQKEYYPESVELVKEITGASKVVVFDHTVRRRRPGELEDSPQKRQPAAQVHVDQSTEAAIARVHRHMPADEAPELLKRRFQIINLWRPIHHEAWDWPLALCDYSSIDVKNDLVPSKLIFPDRVGEVYGVKYSPNYKWKYLKGMAPDEFVLIKCYDSKDDGKTAILTPHTAFDDTSKPEGALPRESIELRLLVFYDE